MIVIPGSFTLLLLVFIKTTLALFSSIVLPCPIIKLSSELAWILLFLPIVAVHLDSIVPLPNLTVPIGCSVKCGIDSSVNNLFSLGFLFILINSTMDGDSDVAI